MAFLIHIAGIRYVNFFFFIFICSVVFFYLNNTNFMEIHYDVLRNHTALFLQGSVVNDFYEKRKSWNTSKLGAILFKNEDYPVLSEEIYDRSFVVLIWKRWAFLQNRHVYYFGKAKHDPLEDCSVKNCIFTGNESLLNTADAVVSHLHTGLIPETESRNPEQRWIFLNDESPINSFFLARKKPTLSMLANVFNWSMTYRSDADIPVPYGRTVGLKVPKNRTTDPSDIVPNWKIKRRDVLAAILISHCMSSRMELLKRLKKQLRIHIHGGCGDKILKNSCPGHFKADCEVMSEYLFYIVIENSKCKEYITEKIFYHAYSRGAIPIIQGPSIEDCERLLPPNSYIHFDSYLDLKDLARDIKSIGKSDKKLLSFHTWRNNFKVLNEHGYFGSKSYHLCRLCEALNYNNDETSIYSETDLKRFLDINKLCKVW